MLNELSTTIKDCLLILETLNDNLAKIENEALILTILDVETRLFRARIKFQRELNQK